jgi:PhnB protein
MKSVNPYLNFDGNTEEAFEFYQSVFGGEVDITRFKDLDDNMGATGADLEKIANVALPIGGGTMLMGDDSPAVMGQSLTEGDNFSINLEADSAEEAEKVFKDLSADGKITMPLEETEWAEKFGMLTDKYGITWSVNYSGEKNEQQL